MRIKKGFVLREVAGQAMVIATGEASKDFHGMIKLNSTGKLVWQGLTSGQSVQEIADTLVNTYGVEHETALADVEALVGQMRDAGFLTE